MSKQKRVANELDQRVAQRTRELAAANEELRKEVAERKRAEEALRQSEARLADGERDLQLTIDTIPVFVATYRPDGTRSFVNRTCQEYMGLTLEEATGTGAKTFPHFHPADAELNDKAWRASLKNGEPLSIEVRVRRADGQYRWHTSRRVPLRDEKGEIIKWYSIGIDIEDQKAAEDALRRSEEALRREVTERTRAEQLARIDETRFRRFFDLPLIGMAVTSPERRFLEVNEKLCQILGYPREELIGRDWASITHPDDLPGNLGLMDETMAGATESYSMDKRYMHRDGQIVYASISVCCVRRTDGTADHFVLTVQDVTARYHVQEQLQRTEAHLKHAQQIVRIASYEAYPPQSFSTVWSEDLYEMVGLKPGSPIPPLDEYIERFVHPDDREYMREALQRRVTADRRFTLDYRVVRPDGTVRYLQSVTDPVKDESGRIVQLVGTILDVTEYMERDALRAEAEAELRRSEARFRSLTELSSDWYWKEDENLRFTYLSSRVDDLTGYSVESSIGKTRWELENMTPVSTSWLEHKAVLEAHRPFRDLELRRVGQDGVVRYLSVSGAPIFDEQGRFKGYEGVGRNITERKRVEEALHQAQAELAHVARVTTLGELAASIAHEINQPLSGIITNAGTCLRMLANDPPNIDGARETARRTLRDGNRASEVITRLRTLFSKKDAVLDAVDLNEATREVIAMSSSELQRDRLVARLELADDLPAVAGDRVQLQQVILNLLLNAADAMSDVEDRPRQVLIRTQRDEGNRVRLSVQDVGVGLDPQSMDKLFQAFYTTKSNGMGIGLSVSRSIIERHHGRLWAAANDGPGATFSFSIPRASGSPAGVQKDP